MEKVQWKGASIGPDLFEFQKNFKGVGNFKIRIPNGLESINIISSTARVLNNTPRDAISIPDYEFARMVVTLNIVVVDSPEDWKGAETCPDTDFLEDLWRWYLDCEKEFATKLKTVTKGKDLGEPK